MSNNFEKTFTLLVGNLYIMLENLIYQAFQNSATRKKLSNFVFYAKLTIFYGICRLPLNLSEFHLLAHKSTTIWYELAITVPLMSVCLNMIVLLSRHCFNSP